MDFFEQLDGQPHNLLPYDGTAFYYGAIMARQMADRYYDELLQVIAWKHEKVVIGSKRVTTKRKVAWYGDQPFSYTYSKTTKTALPWIPVLLELRDIIACASKETYNACLLNFYNNGNEGMAWHSDGEKDLQKNAAIGSLSFGAERLFYFKHKETQKTISQTLENGSLLVMKGVTQSYWLHRLPTTKKAHRPRINLTFRSVNQR